MRLLLDTHALAWWLFDDPRLPSKVKSVIADPRNDIFVSAVSAFEVATKFRVGKWAEIGPLAEAFDEIVSAERFSIIAISSQHAAHAGLLPGNHRDPFDRIIAAQCKLEALQLVSVDRAFASFGTETFW